MKDFKKIISLKISEYESLFNKEDEFYGKDFKSNCKFINGAIKRMLKSKETEEYILATMLNVDESLIDDSLVDLVKLNIEKKKLEIKLNQINNKLENKTK